MKTIVLLIGTLVLATGLAVAQELDTLLEMSFDDLVNMEVVSASKYSQSLLESPSAISIVTREDILYSAAQTIPELLQYVVGMDGYTKTHTDMDVAARGFAYDETSKMLVQIDGQAANVVAYGGMQWPTLPLTLDEIERIEIVRGSASSIHGADALVGTVNIITRNARERGNKVSALYGERGTGQYQAGIAQALDDSWSFSVNGGFTQTEKQGDFETPAAKLVAPNYDLKDWANIYTGTYRVDYEADDLSFSSLGGFTTDTEGYNPSPGDNSIDRSEKQTVFVTNQLQKQLGDDSVVMRLGYRTLRQENQRWDDGDYVYKYKVRKGDGIDFDGQYILKRHENSTLIGGASLSYFEASRDIANATPYVYDESDRLFSAYAQEELRLLDRRLALTVGGRYDKWETLDGVISPRAAVNYALFDAKVNLRVSAGRSFRRPSFDENYYFVTWPGGWFKGAAIGESTEGGTEVAGESLKPERMTSYEFGVRATPDGATFLGLEFFHESVKDNIGYVVYESANDVLNLGFSNTVDVVEVYGVEVEAKRFLTRQVSSFLNYTYQNADISLTGGPTIDWENAPNNKLSGGIRYHGPVAVDLRFRYVSDLAYQEISSIPVADYWTTDLAVSKALANGIFAKLSVMNLLDDERYEYPMYTAITRRATMTLKYLF